MKFTRNVLVLLLLLLSGQAYAQLPPLFAVESGSSTIYQLDPFSGAILNSFPTPVPTHVPETGGADGLAYDGTTLYFTSGLASETGASLTGATNRTVFYLDPSSGAVLDSFELPASSATADTDQAIDALASDGVFLYANRPFDSIILKIDPSSKTVISALQLQFQGVGGMGYNPYDGHLYVSDTSFERVHRVDTSTGTSTRVFNLPPGEILGVDFVQNKMFVNIGENVVEISPADGRQINSFPSPFPLPSHIGALAGDPATPWTCESDALFTVDSAHSTISVLNPDTGQVLQRFLTPVSTTPPGPSAGTGGPEALAFHGGRLRFMSSGHATKSAAIFSVDSCTGAILGEVVPMWPSSAPGEGPGVDALAFGVLNGDPTLFALRPASNEVFLVAAESGVITGTVSIPGPTLSGLGFSGRRGTLVSAVAGASPAVLVELELPSGNTIGSHVLAGSGPVQLDFASNRLFAVTPGNPATIQELGPQGAVIRTIPAPGPQPSALAGPLAPGPPGSTANVTFRVDMGTLELAGLLQPDDVVQVRGDFNQWDCVDTSCVMTGSGGSTLSVTLPLTAPTGSPVHFRFFVALDPARFGGNAPPGWEEPASTGGGDRVFTFFGSDLELPVVAFGDILPANLIPGATDIGVTFAVDMNGAPGFDSATSSVFVNLGQDVFWAFSQGIDENQRFELADPDGDGIFQFEYQVITPTSSGIQYRYGYGTDPANPLGEEAGADRGGPGLRRTRWIVPGPAGWPSSFALPLDFYQAEGPLPIDPNPAAGGQGGNPPTAVDDFAATEENTPIEIDVLANDIDPIGGGLSIVDVTEPTSGATLSDPGNGSIRFTPDTGFSGTVTFDYTMADITGRRDRAEVSVMVLPVNEPPVAVDDQRSAFEGAEAAFDVLSNDSDPDGDLVRLLSVEDGRLGTTSIVGDRVAYTPNLGAVGTDTFTYVIGDGNGGTSMATCTVNLRAQPADDDGVEQTTEQAAPNNGDGNGDGIPDSEQANVASLPSATSGQYITVAAETGSELIGVTSSASSPAPMNMPPPSEATFPAGFLDFRIGGGSGNRAVTLELTFDPTEGINAYYKYGPTPDVPTPHWYRFDFDGETGAVFDGNTVTLHFIDGERGDDDLTENGIISDPGAPGVVPNKAPEARSDLATVDEDNGIVIDVLLNDTDENGDPLTVAQVTQPTNGTVTLIGGVITYTPNPDFFGSDTFNYLVTDGNGGTVSASVTVTINPINDAPRFTTFGSIFTLPIDGSEVIVGGPSFEMPGDGSDKITIQYSGATDVENNPVSYKWVLGTNAEVNPPILEADTDETELSFLVSEVAEVLDGSGATQGAGTTVYHRVIASDGLLETPSPVSSFVLIRGFVTALEDEALPKDFELHQNYPNPFNPVTNIRFGLPRAGKVVVQVFDSLGRRVGTLVDGTLPAGYHRITFDGVGLPSGVYIYSMRAQGFSDNKALVLVK